MSSFAFSVKGSMTVLHLQMCGGVYFGREGARSVDVKDFLQRVDVRIDEQASIDFDRRIGSEAERLRLELLRAEHLVIDVIACQKPLDQTRFVLLRSGDKPYGHPPSLPPNCLGRRLDKYANGRPDFRGSQISQWIRGQPAGGRGTPSCPLSPVPCPLSPVPCPLSPAPYTVHVRLVRLV